MSLHLDTQPGNNQETEDKGVLASIKSLLLPDKEKKKEKPAEGFSLLGHDTAQVMTIGHPFETKLVNVPKENEKQALRAALRVEDIAKDEKKKDATESVA